MRVDSLRWQEAAWCSCRLTSSHRRQASIIEFHQCLSRAQPFRYPNHYHLAVDDDPLYCACSIKPECRQVPARPGSLRRLSANPDLQKNRGRARRTHSWKRVMMPDLSRPGARRSVCIQPAPDPPVLFISGFHDAKSGRRFVTNKGFALLSNPSAPPTARRRNSLVERWAINRKSSPALFNVAPCNIPMNAFSAFSESVRRVLAVLYPVLSAARVDSCRTPLVPVSFGQKALTRACFATSCPSTAAPSRLHGVVLQGVRKPQYARVFPVCHTTSSVILPPIIRKYISMPLGHNSFNFA